MALMDREQIKEIIPHRDPFLLIDEIESIDEERGEITAIKYVRESEYYFEGHFPQKKVMPGVLIVEALAQAGAVAILSREKFRGRRGAEPARKQRQAGPFRRHQKREVPESGGAGRYTASFRDDGKAGLKSGNRPRHGGNSAAGRRFSGRKDTDRLPV